MKQTLQYKTLLLAGALRNVVTSQRNISFSSCETRFSRYQFFIEQKISWGIDICITGSAWNLVSKDLNIFHFRRGFDSTEIFTSTQNRLMSFEAWQFQAIYIYIHWAAHTCYFLSLFGQNVMPLCTDTREWLDFILPVLRQKSPVWDKF
jgi:hypothetical protein